MDISIICGFSFGCSLAAIIFAGLALIKVIAFEKSTHRIEYMPIDPNQATDFSKQLEKQLKEEEQDLEV